MQIELSQRQVVIDALFPSFFCLCSHQASEDSEGHGGQQEQHQNQILGTPDQFHALGVLSLWRQVRLVFSGFSWSTIQIFHGT